MRFHDIKSKLSGYLTEFMEKYKDENKKVTGWGEPLIAFADVDDGLFLELKTWVSETHKMPRDLLRDAETVIAYFIPFNREVASSNVGRGEYSRGWAIAYTETNKLIMKLNEGLAEKLAGLGFRSAIFPATHNFDEERLISHWSHKHVAYIAGLGRFGLHHMLITEKGCCGRLGSLITDAKIEPTMRPDEVFCLYRHDKSCRACVDNCTFEALKIGSFDGRRCYDICLSNARLYLDLGLADACGKCICVVPCSFVNPVK